jgi:hypothetical protein
LKGIIDFFDDNIEFERAHIIDIQNSKTLESVPFENAKNKFIVKSEPFFAIIDHMYFVKEIDRILQKINGILP